MWQFLLELAGGSEAGELGRVCYHLLSGLIPALAILSLPFTLYWHHRCCAPSCWYYGRYHDVEGRPACSVHRHHAAERHHAQDVREAASED